MSPLLHHRRLLLLLLLHRALLLLADPGGGCEGACGDVTVKLPFWLHASSEDGPSCGGLSPFAVSCDAHNTTAALQGSVQGSYTIESIFYDNYSFLVHDPNVYLNGCPRRSFNLTTLFGLSQFRVSRKNRQIVFLDCQPPGLSAVRMNCGGDRYVFDGGWYGDDVNLSKVVTLQCNSSFLPVVTLFGVVAEDWNKSLSSGFLLEWTPPYVEEAGTSKTKGAVVISVVAAVGGVSFIAIGVFIFFYLYKRKKKRSRSLDPVMQHEDIEFGGSKYTQIFSYAELVEATDGFSSSRELGDGGFGSVYKGKLRDGRVVAVKRLYQHNYRRVEQFVNEVGILSRLRHPNLVTLYGCTSPSSQDLILVYEYIPNGTVADHLHGSHAHDGALTWPLRMNIAIETADALAYLHAEDSQIIHRDIKTNNILLDASFHVKVADFGLSRLFPLDVSHVSTVPQGTPGYVDPVYHQCYQLTDKSDVYSFGVVLAELISSKPAVDMNRSQGEINLASMAVNKIQNYMIEELVDPNIGYESDGEVKRMVDMVAEVAFRCLQQDRDMRPPIREVLEALRGIQSGSYENGKPEKSGSANETSHLLRKPVEMSPATVIHRWSSQSTSAGLGA